MRWWRKPEAGSSTVLALQMARKDVSRVSCSSPSTNSVTCQVKTAFGRDHANAVRKDPNRRDTAGKSAQRICLISRHVRRRLLDQASDSATVGRIPRLARVPTNPVNSFCLSGTKALFGGSARHRHGHCINESDKTRWKNRRACPQHPRPASSHASRQAVDKETKRESCSAA